MTINSDHYCSLATPELEMAGTADPVDVWLLLEYPMSWKAKVFEDNQLAEDTRQWLAKSIERLQAAGKKVRPQFIRQPEYERSSMRFILATAELSWQLEGQGYSYLHDLELTEYLESLPQGAEQLNEPRYFVCMNGQRDRCCARFGRPIYSALREQYGDRVWQVTHLGGHRFAPNVLTLPQGGMHGRVSEANVTAFAEQIENDQLHFETLRGLAWYGKAAQAAQVFAARQGQKPLNSQELEGGKVRVELLHLESAERSFITVGQAAAPIMALASCKDDQPKPVHPYILVDE